MGIDTMEYLKHRERYRSYDDRPDVPLAVLEHGEQGAGDGGGQINNFMFLF